MLWYNLEFRWKINYNNLKWQNRTLIIFMKNTIEKIGGTWLFYSNSENN
jgi:hypothetical protein